jgi:hypothetical protein
MEGRETEEMVAVSVRNVDRLQVLAAGRDPLKQPLRLLDR